MTDKQLLQYRKMQYVLRHYDVPELMEIIKHTAIELHDSDGVSPRNLSPEGYRSRHLKMRVCVQRVIELTGGKF